MERKSMLFDSYQIQVQTEQALKWLRLDEDFAQELEPLCKNTTLGVRPKILVRPLEVQVVSSEETLLNDKPIFSKVVAARLKSVKRAFAYVGTCGVEADALAGSYGDELVSYWQQALNERVMRLAMAQAQAQVCDRFDLKPPLSALNPGSLPDWPLSAQKDLFALLGDVTAQTGVVLDEVFWMHPVKSSSGIWFETTKSNCNCQLCLRKNCIGRRMPFDSLQYHEIFGIVPTEHP